MEDKDSFFVENAEPDSNILNHAFRYIRYWYWFVISIIISLTISYVYLKQYTPIYQVKATLLIKDEQSLQSANGEEVMQEFSVGASKQLENEITILRSRALISKVIDELSLTTSYWKKGRFRDVEIYKTSSIKVNATALTDYAYNHGLFIKPVSIEKYELFDQDMLRLGTFMYSQDIKSKFGNFRVFLQNKSTLDNTTYVKIIFSNKSALINELINSIQVAQLVDNSSFLSLTIDCSLIDKGKDILTTLLDEYAFNSLEDKNREATSTLRFIEERLKLITAELGNVEQDVENFRKSTGTIDLSSEANLFLQKIEQNDIKINETDIFLKGLNSVREYIKNSKTTDIAPASLISTDPVLNSYILQLSELEIERIRLAQSVQPTNASLESINLKIKNVRQAINTNIETQRNNINLNRERIVISNKRLERGISSVPEKERRLVDIKRQASIKENLYLLLFQKREETALSYASSVTDSRVVDVPFSDGNPTKPNKKNTYTFSFIIGLCFPILLLLFKESITTTIQSKKEIELRIGKPIFGEINKKSKKETKILVGLDKSFLGEQIRTIRSNLNYLFPNVDHEASRSILFTSSISKEGKSFTSVNIAASLSMLDKKVIIIDLDMRKPKIAKYLNQSGNTGISNYLINEASIDSIIQPTLINNLYVITSGPIPPNPSELIANGRMKILLDQLKKEYQYIIIDTPPLGLVTDAILLAPFVDVCLYLVRHERTPKLFLKYFVDLQKRNIFKSLHVIFNAVNRKNSGEYNYGYDHGYYDYFDKSEKVPNLFKLFKNRRVSSNEEDKTI